MEPYLDPINAKLTELLSAISKVIISILIK